MKYGFSVLISVYHKDSILYLKESLDSIFNQTLFPSEVIIVEDGLLTADLYELINSYYIRYKDVLKRIKICNNSGLGISLNEGLKYCTFDIVARMDSDDICFSDRFEKQFNYLINNPEIVLVGSVVEEFQHKIGDLKILRNVPLNHSDIFKFSKFRNPINHPSVMFRKKKVLEVGSYEPVPFFEDYYLWLKLLNKGFLVMNLNEPLLYFRIGNDLISRRSGYKYFKHELHFLMKSYKLGFINFNQLIINLTLKAPIRLFPKKIIQFMYKNLLRSK